MTDMNNRSMNDNNENRNNDPKERMRKKVKKAAGIALCAVLAGGLAAGSFEGVNALTGWNSSRGGGNGVGPFCHFTGSADRDSDL